MVLHSGLSTMKYLTLLALAAIPSVLGTSDSDASSSSWTSSRQKNWFSFGDSYTDTGFLVNGTQPSTSNPIGNPAFPGNTQCGAEPVWLDYLITQYNTTFVESFNHAYSGATIDVSLVTGPLGPGVNSLVDQVNNFLNYEVPGKQYYNGWTASNTMFSVWIGINDIGSSFQNNGSRSAFDDTLLNRYFELVQTLYNHGARNFLFLSVPPVYRTPILLNSYTAADRTLEKSVITDFNTKLSAKVREFDSCNPGTTTKYYDTTLLFNTILDNPTRYGFQDATSFGDGNQYAWCNFYHPSPPFHLQIAKAVAPLIKGIWI